MKYSIILVLLFAINATAQTTTYEASVNHLAISYDHTPNDILFSHLTIGNKDNTYASASISIRPLVIETKLSEFVKLEPFVFFEYGFDGNTFTNYGFGATHQINKKISASVKYSQWGGTASVTF